MATTTSVTPKYYFPESTLAQRTRKDGTIRWSRAEMEAWSEEGHLLARAENTTKWELAKWVQRGFDNERPNMEARNAFSFTLAEASRITGYAVATLYRMVQVARAFPDSRRRENPDWEVLSWSHFNEVLPIEDVASQDRLLNEASKRNPNHVRHQACSVSYLRLLVKGVVRARNYGKRKKPNLKLEEIQQYAPFEVPLDRLPGGGINVRPLRVLLSEPERRFLERLAKARKKKKPGEVVRELLAEMAETRLGAWKVEVASVARRDKSNRAAPFVGLRMKVPSDSYYRLEKLAVKLGRPSVADLLWWMAREYYREHGPDLDAVPVLSDAISGNK